MAEDMVRHLAAANGVALSAERAIQLQPLWEGHRANVAALDQLRERLQAVPPAGTLRLPHLPATTGDATAGPAAGVVAGQTKGSATTGKAVG